MCYLVLHGHMGSTVKGHAKSLLTKSIMSWLDARENSFTLRTILVWWHKRKQVAGSFSILWNPLEPFMCSVSIYIQMSFDKLGYDRLYLYTHNLITLPDSNLGKRTSTLKGLVTIWCGLAVTKRVKLPRKSWVWTCDVALWSFMMQGSCLLPVRAALQ